MALNTNAATKPLDRAHIFPNHEGPNILPNNPLFSRLLRHAHRDRIAITDLNLSVTRSYGELLSDVLSVRDVLRQWLKPKGMEQLRAGEEVYVGILTAGGYEWAVAMLAVLALGAAAVPMSVQQPPTELAYFVTKAKQTAILCSPAALGLAEETIAALQTHDQDTPPIIDVSSSLPDTPRWRAEQILISSSTSLSDTAPALVIFTSGTTGRPKGCVLRRLYTHESAATVCDSFDIATSDSLLHVLPIHHATGIGTSFFPFMNAGAKIIFRSGPFDEGWVWERLCEGETTVFSGVPTMFTRLMWYYEQHISRLPEPARRRYDEGTKSLRAMLCGSSALQDRVQAFWTKIRGGRSILVRYGSSEVPSVIRVPARLDRVAIPRGCVGLPTPGLDWRITEEGELLLRSPFMFSKYLHDRDATVAAHTADGYFQTGDLAHADKDGFIFIDGRVSTDIIKSGGYKIGAPDVERAILELPYAKEAMVVGVEDEEWGQRVGAAVVVSTAGKTQLDLVTLRNALRKSLPGYKIPTVLRIVDDELPKGETGKVQKKILGPQYFVPDKWRDDPAIQVWESSVRSSKL